nr:hypothetical protein [uncultured Oscillibacter sp.]
MTYGFTDAELDLAKHTDLLDLLPSLGYTLKRIGGYYTTAEMDSIRIRDPTRWRRYSTQQGGDAISFLREFCGMRFPEAVDYLLAYHSRYGIPESETCRKVYWLSGNPSARFEAHLHGCVHPGRG